MKFDSKERPKIPPFVAFCLLLALFLVQSIIGQIQRHKAEAEGMRQRNEMLAVLYFIAETQPTGTR